MSAFIRFELGFTDTGVLIESLAEMNTRACTVLGKDRIETHPEGVSLNGYMGDEREEKAVIVIRRNNVGTASNDIGFAYDKTTKTYYAVISAFDKNFHNDEWLGKLKGLYAVKSTIKALKAKGEKFTVSKTIQNGKQVMRIVVQ